MALAFPGAQDDIWESGRCLALDRNGAAVYHLMKVLEIGLKILAAKFGITIDNKNWHPVIEQIEIKIKDMKNDVVWKNMPDFKEQERYYSQVVAGFAILKNAWRNYTMHGNSTYTHENAANIFILIKMFMQTLAEKLCE